MNMIIIDYVLAEMVETIADCTSLGSGKMSNKNYISKVAYKYVCNFTFNFYLFLNLTVLKCILFFFL